MVAENKSSFLKWYHGFTGARWGTEPGDYDPDFVRGFVDQLQPFYGPEGYFGVEVEGWENIPEGPVLVVSNHSGGAAAPDVWGFLIAWNRHFEAKRVIHSMAHEFVLSIRATGEPFSRAGVLRANPMLARNVFRDWKRDVFVMPGGDVDVFRPYSKRYDVQFAGRQGYLRLAMESGVPIVPVANAGAHETLIVLTDGRKIASGLGLKRLLRLNVFPIHLSFPWMLAVGPWPHLPPPTLLRYKIGAPIHLPQSQAPSCELLGACDLQVQGAIQGMLNQLREEAPQKRKHLRKICGVGFKKATRQLQRLRSRLRPS